MLRLLGDRRRSLGEEHARKTSRLHHLLPELIPGEVKPDLTAPTKALLSKISTPRPRRQDPPAIAAELLADLSGSTPDQGSEKELIELVIATGSALLDLPGIGPTGAARILAEVGDITRFLHNPVRLLDRHRAPGRLLRRPDPPPALPHGNRKSTTSLHAMEPSARSASTPTAGPTTAASAPRERTHLEALRCLKRRISDAVYLPSF